MKIFSSCYHKNIVKTFALLWASKSCYLMFDFKKQLHGKEHQYNASRFLFFLKKTKPKKKKKINIKYLVMALIKKWGC